MPQQQQQQQQQKQQSPGMATIVKHELDTDQTLLLQSTDQYNAAGLHIKYDLIITFTFHSNSVSAC